MDFIFYDWTITELPKAFSEKGFWFGIPTSFHCKGYITASEFGKNTAVITSHIHTNIRFGSKTIFTFSVSSKLIAIVNAITIT